MSELKQCPNCDAGFMVGTGEFVVKLYPRYANYCVVCDFFCLLDAPYGGREFISFMKKKKLREWSKNSNTEKLEAFNG